MAKNFIKKNNLTKEILLKTAHIGILTLPALTSPYFLHQIVKKYFGEKNEKRVRRIRELQKKKLINIEQLSDGSIKISLSYLGKIVTDQYKFDEIKIQKPKKWDGYWRVIIYDIPQKFHKARNAFREKIKKLGMYQLQKSIWIHPYNCFKELDFLCAIFGIPLEDCVYIIKTKEIPKEKEIRNFFKKVI